MKIRCVYGFSSSLTFPPKMGFAWSDSACKESSLLIKDLYKYYCNITNWIRSYILKSSSACYAHEQLSKVQWIVQWLWLWVETVSMLHPSRIEVYYASTIQCRLEQDLVRFFWAFRRFRRVLSRLSDFISIWSFTLPAHQIASRFWFAQFYEMMSQKECSRCKFTASSTVLQHAWAGRLGHGQT